MGEYAKFMAGCDVIATDVVPQNMLFIFQRHAMP